MDEIFTMKNDLGMEIICSSVGAGLVDIRVPDRDGKIESVLVRPKKFYQYYRSSKMFGKPCGRTAGRLSPVHVVLPGGTEFTAEENVPGSNVALHGGKKGISDQPFNCERKEDKDSRYFVFTYLSEDGESGYPGNLKIRITFELKKNENRLIIHHEAISDKDTLCNLTCHAYFNLSGNAQRKVLDETLYLNADKVAVLNSSMIPVRLMKVNDNFSFLTPHKIGDHIEEKEVQHQTGGYDHPYLLQEQNPDIVQARLYDEKSGRQLEIKTSYEACVLYSSNSPSGLFIQNDQELGKYDAICMEMSHFPNSINSSFISNKQDFLKADDKYDNFIEYSFSVR